MNAYARSTDPETSHWAAASVRDLRASQFAVLKVLRKRPNAGYTDEQLVEAYEDHTLRVGSPYPRQSASGIRSRRAELVRLGFVEYAGEKRTMSTGREARVWRVR